MNATRTSVSYDKPKGAGISGDRLRLEKDGYLSGTLANEWPPVFSPDQS
jgi:hypothetical protein